jgi:hypothetical protein
LRASARTAGSTRGGPACARSSDGGRAWIGFRPLRERHERRSDLYQVALGAEQAGDASALGRGDLHHRLVGLDRHQRLVGDDVVALRDVPGDDLGLLEALAEVGQEELAHGEPPTASVHSKWWVTGLRPNPPYGHQANSQTRCAAAAMRAAEGM